MRSCFRDLPDELVRDGLSNEQGLLVDNNCIMPIVPDAVTMFIPGVGMPFDALTACNTRWGKKPEYRLENLRFTRCQDGVKITGSLPKYLRGENASPSTPEEIDAALLKLETTTRLSLEKGIVWQLEFGTTVRVSHPPIEYLRAWNAMSGASLRKEDGDGNTVYFYNKTWQFKGYDKGLEMHPNPLPECFGDGYGLRIELGFHRSISKYIKSSLAPKELVDPNVLKTCQNLWQRRYHEISKSNGFRIRTIGDSPRELLRQLASLGLEAEGRKTLEGMIAEEVSQGRIPSYVGSRMRQTMKSLEDEGGDHHQSELNRELDEAVQMELTMSA